MGKRDIMVMGGSAGSAVALRRIIGALPRDFTGSVFVTVHIPTNRPSHLSEILDRAGALPVSLAADGQPIEGGRIYVAAPDRHLLVMKGMIQLGNGPRENMVRPSIDPMFRSAALSYGPRVVGVILSGMLNDGASGLFAIKRAGGVALVQHLLEAVEDGMPRAALEAVEVDHVVSAEEIGELLVSLARTDAGPPNPTPESLAFEVRIASGAGAGSEALLRFATPSPLTCPGCGGVLSEVKDDRPLRYRCQIGHAYTAEELSTQYEQVDEAIRVAMRIVEERAALVRRMAADARDSGRTALAELYEARAREYQGYAETLRRAAFLSMRAGRAPQESPNSSHNASSRG